MSNQPGAMKREKNTAKEMAQSLKAAWKASRKIVGHTISGLGVLGEGALKATEITFNAGDTILSFFITDSCVRSALQHSVKMFKDLRAVTRGIQNFGQWVAGEKKLDHLYQDLLGYFKGGNFTADLIFPELLIDGAEIGIEKSKLGSILILKFDDRTLTGKPKYTDMIRDKWYEIGEFKDFKSSLIIHNWNPIKVANSTSFKWETFGCKVQTVTLQYVPKPEEELKYVPEKKIDIGWTDSDVYLVTEDKYLNNLKKIQRTSYLGDESKVKPLYIENANHIVKAYNDGKDYKILFPNCELTKVNVYCLPHPKGWKEGDLEGSFVRFSFNLL